MVVTGGMPEMVFEYILKENGIDPEKDLTIIQNIDFGLERRVHHDNVLCGLARCFPSGLR